MGCEGILFSSSRESVQNFTLKILLSFFCWRVTSLKPCFPDSKTTMQESVRGSRTLKTLLLPSFGNFTKRSMRVSRLHTKRYTDYATRMLCSQMRLPEFRQLLHCGRLTATKHALF